MSVTFLLLILGGAIIAVVLLARFLKSRNSGGYQRRFVNGASRQDEAFPYVSTLYVGDGGGASHSSDHHSTDCAHTSDSGGGCSDGGGSN
jgi:hypothetical protein